MNIYFKMSLMALFIVASTTIQADPVKDFYDKMLSDAKAHSFSTEEKQEFLDRVKKQLPITVKEQAFYYGPDVIDALAELYATYNMGTRNVDTIRKTAFVSTLSHCLSIANQYRTKVDGVTNKKNFPNYARALANALFISKDYAKYKDANAVANKNRKNPEYVSSEKNKCLLACILANCLLLYGSYHFVSAREKFDFEGLELTKEHFVTKWEKPSTLATAAYVAGEIIKYLAKYCRYSVELSDLENYAEGA